MRNIYVRLAVFFTVFVFANGSLQNHNCQCQSHQFECPATIPGECMCIPSKWHCDQDNDCEDNADEIGCDLPPCKDGEFVCSNGKCLRQEWVCDGDNDCGDGSDEARCVAQNCTIENDMFQCHNGNCIRASWVCDGDNDCLDGSDEICEGTCRASEFTCLEGGCIDTYWKCDGDRDCMDGSDEIDCDFNIPVCPHEQFLCSSGECVFMHYFCDGEEDCEDGSDEVECLDADRCEADEITCVSDDTCIKAMWRCDGDQDCDDMSDETGCGNITCVGDQFQCTSGRCITQAWKCDGEEDCADGSDELDCEEAVCAPDQFQCTTNHECIGRHKVCNRRIDCTDGSDELPHYPCSSDDLEISSCANANGGCEQSCTNLRPGVRCSCLHGYQLAANGKNCLDLDECEVEGRCSQVCHNVPGGFRCSCVQGYELRLDGITCKALGPEPYLLFANRIDILRLQPDQPAYTRILDNLEDAIALDYHIEYQLLFWSDVTLDSIMRGYLNGTEVMNIVSSGLDSPGGLAVDWLGDKLYWADSGTSRIEVSKLDGRHRSVLVWDNLDKPRALSLHPSNGTMFWTDWGTQPKIESASMDGSSRNVIADTNLFWPNGLVIDYATDKLFWVDAKHHMIESAGLDGRGRKVVIDQGLPHPFAITLFEDEIFWTDWHTKSINAANKFRGNNITIIQRQLHYPMDIHSFHPIRQPPGTNRCNMENNRCSHLCLPNKQSYTCACPTGLRKLDAFTCQEDIDSFLIFTRETDIRLVSFDTSDRLDMVIPLEKVKVAIGLDWDERDGGYIYWSDAAFDTISRAKWDGSMQETLIGDNLKSADGLSVDWINNKMYWTEADLNRIEVANLDGTMRLLLIWENVDKPRDIIVDPLGRVMYWTDWGQHPKIEQAGMDGTQRITLISENLEWPNGLAIDYDLQRLYWTDGNLGVIEYSKLDGTRRETLINELSHPFGLTVDDSYVYWTDWNNYNIKRANKKTGRGREVLVEDLERLMDVKIFSRDRPRVPSPCGSNNGGCSHLCLLSPSSRSGFSCACPTGVILGEDGLTCHNGMDNFLLYSRRNQFQMVSLDVPYIADVWVPIKGLGNAVALDLDIVNERIFWSDVENHKISSANLDGSDVQVVIGANVRTTDGIAVDQVSQKLYWTDAEKDRVEVAELNGENRLVLFNFEVDKPRAIYLYPEKGLMYWSDWGKEGRIERAWMDGQHREVIVEDLVWPNGLVIDKDEEKLYWIDANRQKLECSDLDGSNIQILVEEDGVQHPYGMSLHGDFVYWTDWGLLAIKRVRKSNRSDVQTVIGEVTELMDIKAIPRPRTIMANPCSSNNGGCSHLCLITPTGFSCACPTGINLQADGRTCANVPSDFLLFSSRKYIRRISLDTEDENDVILPIRDFTNIIALDFDSVDRKIYFSDVHLNVIMRANYDGTEIETVISDRLKIVDGLAVDWIAGNLFWTNAGRHKIEVARLNGSSRKVIVDQFLDEPRAIALCPERGYLFWTDWGLSRIERSYFDGSGRSTLISNVRWPNGLTIDYEEERLYWTDANTGSIESANLHGGDRRVVLNQLNSTFGITLFGNMLYWTDRVTYNVQTVMKDSGTGRRTLLRDVNNLMDIKVVSSSRQAVSVQNPCADGNGGCTHLCLVRPRGGHICACPDDPNARQCSSIPGAPDLTPPTTSLPTKQLTTRSTTRRITSGNVPEEPPNVIPGDLPPVGDEDGLDNHIPVDVGEQSEVSCSPDSEAKGLCTVENINGSTLHPNAGILALLVACLLSIFTIFLLVLIIFIWRRQRRPRGCGYSESRSNYFADVRFNAITNEISTPSILPQDQGITYCRKQDNAFLAANSSGKISNAELARMLPDNNGGACSPSPYSSKYFSSEKCNGENEYDTVMDYWEDEKFKPTRV